MNSPDSSSHNHRPLLIAEIGWNHMGDMGRARAMIAAAAENGADVAKFQTWSVRRLVPGEWDEDGRRQIYEQAELSREQHEILQAACAEHGIAFLSSACSLPDAELLRDLGVDRVKIPSPDCRNRDLVGFALENFREVMVSTGTATREEIESLAGLEGAADKLTLFHCVSSYPCPPERANLPRIAELRRLHPRIGYSDHTEGVDCAVVSLGYRPVALEKHFTIDRSLPGRDNRFAILPDQLAELRRMADLAAEANRAHGVDYQEVEGAVRAHYAGRFNGPERASRA